MKKAARKILSLITVFALILCMSGCNISDSGVIFVHFRDAEHLYSVMPDDIEIIKTEFKTQLPENDITVVPVYSFLGKIIGESEGFLSVPIQVQSGSVLANDSEFISVLGIEEEYSHLIGLDEMSDETAYFLDYYKETIELDNTEIILRTESTVSDSGLYSLIKSEYIDSGTINEPVCYVNMATMDKMVADISDGEYTSASDSAQDMKTFCIAATVIYTDNVKETMKVLNNLNYKCSAEYK